MTNGKFLVDPKEIILTLIDSNGGFIDGRTVLQKAAYFAGEKLKVDLGFSPHYYGPYSREVEATTELLVSQGLLTETIERLSGLDAIAGFEPRKYHYQMTPRGHAMLDRLRSKDQSTVESTKELLKSIKSQTGLNPGVLSAGAKIHFIVSAESRGSSPEAIRRKAQNIGWELSEEEIRQVGKLLVSLGFLKTVRK